MGNELTGTICGSKDDEWSVNYYEDSVEIWCENRTGGHGILLDKKSMVKLRDMLNEKLWRDWDE